MKNATREELLDRIESTLKALKYKNSGIDKDLLPDKNYLVNYLFALNPEDDLFKVPT